MNVRMYPKPHILCNLPGDYFADRVVFGRVEDDDLFFGEVIPPGPGPDEILGVPNGTYRRCNLVLLRSVEKKLVEVQSAEGDTERVSEIRALFEAIDNCVDHPPEAV